MADLVKKNIASIVTKRKLSDLVKGGKYVILCDVSASMNEPVTDEGRKIDVLIKVLENFPDAKIYEFSWGTKIVFGGTLSNPHGGTDLAEAFQSMKKFSHDEFILITDGMPDSARDALNESKGLKINIIYVGPQPVPDFLKDLAKATGGKFENVDLISANSSLVLANKIKGFLKA